MQTVPLRLTVIQGPNLGQEYALQGDNSIGRSTRNDISLPYPEVSRRHARLWQVEGSAFIEDLGSTNGTFVNDVRLRAPQEIYDGDEIQLGDSLRLLFLSAEGVTRPLAIVGQEAGPSAVEESQTPSADSVYAESEIPTPTPPLFTNLDAAEGAPKTDDQDRRYILWCGCLPLVLLSACMSTILFLDAYQGGRFLYCGGLRPLFQLLLGSFGFSPLCP